MVGPNLGAFPGNQAVHDPTSGSLSAIALMSDGEHMRRIDSRLRQLLVTMAIAVATAAALAAQAKRPEPLSIARQGISSRAADTRR